MRAETPAPTADLPRTYTAREVAEIFRVSEATITNWLKRGKLPPPVCVGGGKYVWPATVIERMLAPTVEGRA